MATDTLSNFLNVPIENLTSFRGVKINGQGPAIRFPGIGDASADGLEENGIMTPLQLLGLYLFMADEEAFVARLVEYGCVEWRVRDPAKGTLTALRGCCEKLFSG